ncbi:MAG: ATPase, P-type (Transporting), HAD superfamily, subfamily IC [Candidatus Collierbacteria bacterium GW2011_GWB1_44_197]|nr:MAG: ATPase, P-type (Transporting), HAD superfamily, subfamily IC [Candidatus Collierbacteria bacterium GW2011_GWB1_44_197]
MLNVVMGFSQEYSAQKTLGALRKIIKPFATVIRSGKRQIIEASSLVPGDIVLLGSGDNVPADGSLLEGVDMFISESILTGESEPVKKSQREKYPHLYMGTTVIGGRGTMMVEKIGTQTEIGRW